LTNLSKVQNIFNRSTERWKK